MRKRLKMSKKAVVLLSGGLDSATTLWIAKSEGFELYAMTFNYGQRHLCEIEAAEKISRQAGVKEHKVIRVGLETIGGSSLTDKELPIPHNRSPQEMKEGIPLTYVPARNIIFLSCALSWAEVIGTGEIFIGASAVDYSGYPDCRPAFIKSFERTANLGTKMGVEGRKIRIHSPLINLSRKDIIKKGLSLGVDYSLTWSCYEPLPDGGACGCCDSCNLRRKGFREAGIPDPLTYHNE